MHIIRKQAKQGHPIPRHSYAPQGPFPPELYAKAPIKYPDEPPGQVSTELFLCRACGAHLYEDELADHNCDEE